MIRIDRNRCVGCGHCEFVRMNLPRTKIEEGVEYYEDPCLEDRQIVENAISDCWGRCVEIIR
jgi:ferredoxin